MKLIDLTCTIPERENNHPLVALDEWAIGGDKLSYTGMVYHFNHWSMSGTYIDLPGHIKELDDGSDVANYPLEKLYQVPSVLVRLNRDSQAGKVTADDLHRAVGKVTSCGCVIVNALGDKRYDQIPGCDVSLSQSAINWIADTGAHLLVSDIYESRAEPENVFWWLFSAGISTVCMPDNLAELPEGDFVTTVLFPKFPGVTQLPCRIVAQVPG